MKAIFRIAERFGSFPANGDVANAFRFTEVEPALAQGAEVTFDFADVTNMTSSFCNGLVATLMAHHSQDFVQRVRFTHCDSAIQELIRAAIAIGRREAREFA
jgi:STAS-like domain of unknown function (DUF4325)